MKFRQHLSENVAPEYGFDAYLAYERLDEIIRVVSQTAPASADLTNRQVSLTMPPPTNAQGVLPQSRSKENIGADYTDENFLKTMDEQMAKVESFTLEQVTALRASLKQIEGELSSLTTEKMRSNVENQTDKVAEDFLRLEKYVNINFMGFHKILKKHDKHIPSKPIKAFYVNRMHGQSWVRGDYSDVVVRLSSIYSSLRNDQVNVDNTGSKSQSFLRSTTKYWVKTEDVSRVKYAILRHLPVFLQKTSTGESDSQMTNSVYLDNDQLELYHGRLDKTPGAIALRLRWYGAGDPKVVFVERKTHREKWTGEVSEKKEIDESEVHQVMTNTYNIAEKKSEMMGNSLGKSQEEADEFETLASEITQVISSKQLVPTMRTQYMRTAFQIPFDATVRVSLDTNLCMISERGYDLKGMRNWHRDPSSVLAANEITRFPHAVLEIKLELTGSNMTPPKWVTDLQNSGMLYEVHKFSKFIHGCAILLPEDVQSVPYWVDDASIRESIIASDGQRILVDANSISSHVGPGSNQIYNHLLPFGHMGDDRVSSAVGRTSTSKAASAGYIHAEDVQKDYGGINFYDADVEGADLVESAVHDDCCDDTCLGWVFPCCTRDNIFRTAAELNVAPTSVQKIEPKVFFANERTYLHWLHHAIVLASVASGILAFTDQDTEDRQMKWAIYYALALLTISLWFCVYALHIYLWRAERIKTRIPGHWDDPRGPLVLGFVLVVALAVNFVTKLYLIATATTSDSTLTEL
eukprot:CAMPEP_0178934082 /NCGR_PEP_ID=MMETSP0786-20121207/23672_1 /TAXON_ID=186022 /ORGANISM="Thalassionema frauenfeldii, Strain CCMP 1798" /LENGTH=749 /DNA_ID=CAMNT_0020611839 /DNA_START=99 /DNA_END=2349 /DNA_ORIENTATION=+